MTRFGSGPSATSISTCEMPTLTVTSEPLNDHSPSSRLCASISCPASSSAASTALRASSGEISSFDGGGSAAVSSATAVAVPASIAANEVADSAAASAEAESESVKLGCASALGPLFRLRSASNGDGLVNGEAAGERGDCGSASLDDREGELARDAAGATGRDEPELVRDGVPGAPAFTASPLSNSSSGSKRCAWTNFSRPSSRWKRCSCL